jgi:hypothetical protein
MSTTTAKQIRPHSKKIHEHLDSTPLRNKKERDQERKLERLSFKLLLRSNFNLAISLVLQIVLRPFHFQETIRSGPFYQLPFVLPCTSNPPNRSDIIIPRTPKRHLKRKATQRRRHRPNLHVGSSVFTWRIPRGCDPHCNAFNKEHDATLHHHRRYQLKPVMAFA